MGRYDIVMEKKHRSRLCDKHSYVLEGKEVIVLDIPDEYGYMDDELVELLTDTVSAYL